MIEPVSLNPMGPLMAAGSPLPAAAGRAEKAQEFLTIFYKEMLKNSIKVPGAAEGEEEENSFGSLTAMNTDLLIEQFAKQLAKNQAAQLGWINDR